MDTLGALWATVPLFLIIAALTILYVELQHPHRGHWRWLGLALVWAAVLACAIWVWSLE